MLSDELLAAIEPWPHWVSECRTQCLVNADCLEVLPRLPAGCVDAVVTDPPYGIGDKPQRREVANGKRVGKRNDWFEDSSWDMEINPLWCKAVSPWPCAWFGQWRQRELVAEAFDSALRCEIVWVKDCHVGPPCPAAMRDERIWWFSHAALQTTRFETTVWDEPIIPTWEHRHHRNQKPESLMVRTVTWIEANAILDPFAGSFTTLVACVRTGRCGIGIEIDPGYYATGVKRVQDELGRHPLFAEQERLTQKELLT